MKTLLATALAAVLATSAQAAIYDVALTQNGDSGPDWFGTVETNMSGSVTSASFLVAGETYDTIASGWTPWVFDFLGTEVLQGHVFSEPLSTSTQTVLRFFNYAQSGVVNQLWGFSSCIAFDDGSEQCSGGDAAGTYTIAEKDTPVIPLPAAGWLLLAGLGGLAALRRRTDAARA